jgi:hypothetical protein
MVRTFVVRILSRTGPAAGEQTATGQTDTGPEAERAA